MTPPTLHDFDLHAPITVSVEPPSRPGRAQLSARAKFLLDYLQDRTVRYPSPLFFSSTVVLWMMANMRPEPGKRALRELINEGWVAVEREGGAPAGSTPAGSNGASAGEPQPAVRSTRPRDLQAAEPFSLTRQAPSGPVPMLEGRAREVWAWLEWLQAHGQGPTLVFPSLAHCASASGLERETLYLGLRQLYAHGLVRFEQPPADEREGGGQ